MTSLQPDRNFDNQRESGETVSDQANESGSSKSCSATGKIVRDSIVIGVVFAVAITLIQRLVGFARGILFCRIMPDEQLGQWSMIYSFLLLLAPLAVLGLPGSFGRYVEHYRQRGQLGSFLKRIASVCAITAFGLAALMYVIPGFFSWIIFRQTDAEFLVYMMASALLSVAIFNFVTSLLEALCQVRLVSMMRFTSAIAFAVIGLLLAISWENRVAAVTIGFAIGCSIGTLPGLWYLLRVRSELGDQAKPMKTSSLWARIVPFATWMWLINLVSNVYEVVDRSMLLHLSTGTDEQVQSYVGQYHSGRVLPLMLVGIAVVLCGFLMPYLTAWWEKGQLDKAKEQLTWTIKAISIAFTGVGLLMLWVAPFLFDTVLQGRYEGGQSVLPLALVYCIWYSLVVLAQDYLWCAEKGKMALIAVSIGLVFNVGANFVLIPLMGLQGAVTATAISNLVCLLLLFHLNHRQGWRFDGRIGMTALIPLVLLLPIAYATLAFGLLVFATIRYQWIFSMTEHQQFQIGWAALKNKLGEKWDRKVRA